MFNRSRAIWPKGYERGSQGKIHQNDDYLKQAFRKSCLPQDANLQPSDYQSTALPLELEKTFPCMFNLDYLNSATCLSCDVNNNLNVMLIIKSPANVKTSQLNYY